MLGIHHWFPLKAFVESILKMGQCIQGAVQNIPVKF